MPETASGLMQLWELAKYAWFALLSVLAWKGKGIHDDLEEVKRSYVKTSEIERAIDKISTEIRDQRKETHDDIKGIHDRIDRLK